jgi:anaerobic magnesium-protoporphyrin IX monomethyl ester cyclase
MKVALVNTNRYLAPPVIPVGLEYLIVPLERHGHEVVICDLAFASDPQKDLVSFLDAEHPEVIGFTVRNIDNVLFHRNDFFLDEIAGLIDITRQCSGAPVVAGGTSTLCSVEGLREYLAVDCLIAGPGEEAFPAVVEALSDGAPLPGSVDGWRAGIAPGTVHSRGLLIDYQPYLEGGNPAGLEFRKGCDWSCGFCVERRRPILRREIDAVVAEAGALAAAGVEMFFLCDSEVNLDLNDTKDLLRAVADAETGLKWSGYFRPVPFDREMARLAEGSGCTDLTLSANSWDLSEADGAYGAREVREFMALCNKAGIKVAVDLLVGYPGENISTVESAIELFATLGPETVAVNEFIRLYENTPAASLSLSPENAGNIIGDMDGNTSMLKPVFFSCVERRWLSDRISVEPNFVLADAERTVNYLRLSE